MDFISKFHHFSRNALGVIYQPSAPLVIAFEFIAMKLVPNQTLETVYSNNVHMSSARFILCQLLLNKVESLF